MPRLWNADEIAARIDAQIGGLEKANVAAVRAVRGCWSRALADAPGTVVAQVARRLLRVYGHRWVGYELIRRHEAALAARVKREVRTKLATGLKNPRRRSVGAGRGSHDAALGSGQ